jgi:acyl-CoA carboxylase epsilon subunit
VSSPKPVLRSISPTATPEEVAAIVAAIAELTRRQAPPAPADDGLREWVHAARLTSRRAGLQRGPWRLSGRIGRRTRA